MSYAHLDAPSHTNETKNWFYADCTRPDVIGQYAIPELAGVQVLSGDEIRALELRMTFAMA